MSGYRLVSLGRVLEDKPDGTDYILVTPVEEFYDQPSGDINKFKEPQEGKFLSIGTTNFDTEHEATNKIRARWKSMGSGNRMTPPDVCRNELVTLYQYGDNTEEYYWDEMGREHGLRGREEVVLAFSNKDGGNPKTKPSIEESYTITISTKRKFIEINTTDNDGEACSYNLKLDTKAGILTIKDGLENSLTLNSVDGKLTGTINEDIELNTKRFVLNAEESFTLNTKQHTVNAETQSDTNTPLATFSENVHIHDKLNVDGKTHLHDELEVDSNTHIHGNLTVDGSFDGGAGGGGAGTFHGTLTATGDLNTKSNMTVDGDLTVKGSAIGRYPGPKE